MFKFVIWIMAALLLAVGCQTWRNSGVVEVPAPAPESIRLATYNVHYIILGEETGAWSVGDWERRKGPMDQAVKAVDADIIGFQEMESFAFNSNGDVNLKLDWLLQNNPEYAAAAVGDPAVFPSTQPIFYRTDRFQVRDQGWFFFSDTPDVIYSRTFDGSWPAFASWAAFDERGSGASFRVINVHTDYASRSNRLLTAELIASRLEPWIAAGETVFLVGDLNARLGDRTVDILAQTGLEFTPIAGATYHFNLGINLFGAIDHIAHIGAATPISDPFVLRQKFDGEWPTDHYPVAADFALEQ